MKIAFALFVYMIILISGCDGGSGVSISSTDTQNSDDTIAQQDLIAKYAGATFISEETLEVGETATGDLAMGNWSVRFTADTVSWNHSDVVEVGTYGFDNNSNMVATISGREIPFSGDGTSMLWDSRTYLRLDNSLFDSQESLVSHYDGATYTSVEELDIGENAQGELVMGRWSVRFEGDELELHVQDTVQRGAYTYLNDSAFSIDIGSPATRAYVLFGDRLLVNSVVYEIDSIGLFDSQETLIAYLDGTSYQSAGLEQVGPEVDGTVAVGHWYLHFTSDTFTWDHLNVQEAGTYSFLTEDSFTAILADRELTIEIDRGNIIWDGVRYIKQ